MNKKLAELKVNKSADYHDKVVKALENAGFVLVLDVETFFERHYIVAGDEEKEWEGWEEHLTLERINVNGNYEPSNCEWIPMSEQYKNKQSNHNKMPLPQLYKAESEDKG